MKKENMTTANCHHFFLNVRCSAPLLYPYAGTRWNFSEYFAAESPSYFWKFIELIEDAFTKPTERGTDYFIFVVNVYMCVYVCKHVYAFLRPSFMPYHHVERYELVVSAGETLLTPIQLDIFKVGQNFRIYIYM